MGASGGVVGQLLVAHHTHDFFDEVFLDLQVEAEARRRDGERALALRHRQAQALERVQALRLRERHADHLGGTCHAQGDGCGLGHVDLLVVHGAACGVRRAADVDDQLGDALDVFDGLPGIDAALEAVARIGREVVAARAAGNGLGPPESGFDVDVASCRPKRQLRRRP
jgi:hypothetical protein